MICLWCATAADRDRALVASGIHPIGHLADECLDHGKAPDGCGCGHRPPAETWPSDHHEPHGAQE